MSPQRPNARTECCPQRADGERQTASHADPRTTTRYDRGRQSRDRHATYILATFVAGASR
jgi:hypothetical protein